MPPYFLPSCILYLLICTQSVENIRNCPVYGFHYSSPSLRAPLIIHPEPIPYFPAGVQASHIIPFLHKSSKRRFTLGSNFGLGQFRSKYVHGSDLLCHEYSSPRAFRYSIPIVFYHLSLSLSLSLVSFFFPAHVGHLVFSASRTGYNVAVRLYELEPASLLSTMLPVRPVEGLLPARTKIPVRKFRSAVASASAMKLNINLQRSTPPCPLPMCLSTPFGPFTPRQRGCCIPSAHPFDSTANFKRTNLESRTTGFLLLSTDLPLR